MVFTLGTLFEALLLLVNVVAILNEERFLAKGMPSRSRTKNNPSPLSLSSIVGWGKDYRNEGFGGQSGAKVQLVNLITSVQTLLRGLYEPVM